jgi:hypothetical protein
MINLMYRKKKRFKNDMLKAPIAATTGRLVFFSADRFARCGRHGIFRKFFSNSVKKVKKVKKVSKNLSGTFLIKGKKKALYNLLT